MTGEIHARIGNNTVPPKAADKKKKSKSSQVNWPVAFNPENKSHIDLMNWISKQTTNRSSFIRETLMLRMLTQKQN